MNLSGIAEKFNIAKLRSLADKVFGSCFFPVVTAALTVLCSTFGLEPLIIWYICLCGGAITLLCKDVSPVICLLVFMNIIVSMQHSPDKRGIEWCDPTYMTSAAFLAQAALAVAVFVLPVIYRLAEGIIRRRFKLTPTFFGVCAFGAAMLLNGVFADDYYHMNFVYGLGIVAILLVIFVFMCGNITPNENTYKRIAYTFVSLCAALAVQLLVAYVTLDVVQNGQIERGRIMFGWGTYNQFGALISMCLPAWFYIAIKSKHGWAYLFGAAFNLAIVMLCMSRQAILTAAVIAVVCSVWYFIVTDKEKRIAGGVIIGSLLLTTLIVYLVKREDLAEIFGDLEASLLTGSGRTLIWKEGIKKFKHFPLFGNGFYDTTTTDYMAPGYCGGGFGFTEAVPFMCHNTFVQLLFACGLAGFITYLVHRVQTVISFFKNPTCGRLFIALTVCGLLLTSLLDNHIFYPLQLFIYAALLSVFTVSEKKADGTEACLNGGANAQATEADGQSVIEETAQTESLADTVQTHYIVNNDDIFADLEAAPPDTDSPYDTQ